MSSVYNIMFTTYEKNEQLYLEGTMLEISTLFAEVGNGKSIKDIEKEYGISYGYLSTVFLDIAAVLFIEHDFPHALPYMPPQRKESDITSSKIVDSKASEDAREVSPWKA